MYYSNLKKNTTPTSEGTNKAPSKQFKKKKR